ncbi:MAG: S10 family peptidase [Anaerolineales bacterium]
MSETKPEEKEEKKEAQEILVESHHKITLGGREMSYTVSTGTILLREESERDKESEGAKPKAAMFFTAYTLDGGENRPLTFSFNGGPGSSSVWLHMGVLGPRRVEMEFDGALPRPPFKVVDNEFSLLAQSDLVFIDPISTGFSRPVEGQKAREFHGFKKDIESVGEFIRLYTTRNQRWLSPKFLVGESYGTTRAAALSSHLLEKHGLYLNGIMLISSVLDFATLDFPPGHDLPYILYLPSYAATAWYHNKLRIHRPLEKLLAEVEEFALTEYAAALMKGDTLTARERKQVIEKLTRYTGLSADYLERANLRVTDGRFFKHFLRAEGKTVGRFDSRLTGEDRDTLGEFAEFDPSFSNVLGPYTAAFNHYVRAELKFESDLPYNILNMGVWPWSYAEHENQYVKVAESLRQALVQNPHMKIFVANGYYDLATPYFATEYTFSHMGLSPALRQNVEMSYYEAGHMMYAFRPGLEKLSADLAEFVSKNQ